MVEQIEIIDRIKEELGRIDREIEGEKKTILSAAKELHQYAARVVKEAEKLVTGKPSYITAYTFDPSEARDGLKAYNRLMDLVYRRSLLEYMLGADSVSNLTDTKHHE